MTKSIKKILCFVFAITVLTSFYYVLKPEKKYRVIVLWTGAGEHEWAKRLENVCKNFKWECKTAFCPRELSNLETSLLSDVPVAFADDIVKEFNPHFVISLSRRCQRIFSSTKNYLAISGDSRKIFNVTCTNPEELLEYNALLYASPLINKIKDFFEFSKRSFQGIVWYPSCPATKFERTIPKRLFYCGFQWDEKRNGEEYQKMFSLLDQQGYMDVYGPPDRWECTPNSRRGCLPFDGISLSKAIRASGITLILHAQSHMELEAPTSRIFEAAAACSVIISDRNPFIVREFGENVLYIDGQLKGEQLFNQINEHMQWILSHPREAEIMAKRTHAIFLKKFTLERQIKNLIKMHEDSISSSSNKK